MSTELSQLPWNDLQQAKGDIPWPALRAFAEAVSTDRDVTAKLFEVYDQTYATVTKQICYADLYVPAIFALAAPKLNDDQRREIGAFLLAKMVQAGQDDADLNLETLSAAIGSLGPVVLPLVLEAIDNEPDMYGAWIFLWGLTALAAKTDDPALRDPVLHYCVEWLERADRNEIDPMDAEQAAWTVALLKRTEYTGLLERLSRKPKRYSMFNEYGHALKLLQGRLDHALPPESWEEPVEAWLEPRCQTAKNWYAQRDDDEYAGELGPPQGRANAAEQFIKLLPLNFLTSPLAATLPKELRFDTIEVLDSVLSESLKALDLLPQEWDEPALRELLLEILPRKAYMDHARACRVPPILEAFLVWLSSEGLLQNSDTLAAAVRSWSEEIVAAQTDRNKWGPLKNQIAKAAEAGIDVGDPDFRRHLLDQLSEEFAETAPAKEVERIPTEPSIPIVEHSHKPQRNDPCPCGSGRKYKKCCGNPAKKPADK